MQESLFDCVGPGIVYWIQCNPTLLADADGPHAVRLLTRPKYRVTVKVTVPYLRMRTVRGHESPLQLRRRTVRDLLLADADYPRT